MFWSRNGDIQCSMTADQTIRTLATRWVDTIDRPNQQQHGILNPTITTLIIFSLLIKVAKVSLHPFILFSMS